MGLFGAIIVGFIIYFLYKRIHAIYNVLFGNHPDNRHQGPTTRPDNSRQTQRNKQESGNRIIHDDEGEYVDFEEIKDKR